MSVKTYLKSMAIACCITGAGLLLLALCLFYLNPGETMIRIGIMLIYILSCFGAGFIAGKIQKKRCLFAGILAGLIYFAVLVLLSVLFKNAAGISFQKAASILGLCAAGGALGGIFS